MTNEPLQSHPFPSLPSHWSEDFEEGLPPGWQRMHSVELPRTGEADVQAPDLEVPLTRWIDLEVQDALNTLRCCDAHRVKDAIRAGAVGAARGVRSTPMPAGTFTLPSPLPALTVPSNFPSMRSVSWNETSPENDVPSSRNPSSSPLL